MYNSRYEEAEQLLVDDYDLRETIFDEIASGLQEQFEDKAYEDFLEEVVYSW